MKSVPKAYARVPKIQIKIQMRSLPASPSTGAPARGDETTILIDPEEVL